MMTPCSAPLHDTPRRLVPSQANTGLVPTARVSANNHRTAAGNWMALKLWPILVHVTLPAMLAAAYPLRPYRTGGRHPIPIDRKPSRNIVPAV